MSKSFAIGVSVCLVVFITGLAFSTYGLGVEEDKKDGINYKVATIFTNITATGTAIGFMMLVIAIFRMCEYQSQAVKIGM